MDGRVRRAQVAEIYYGGESEDENKIIDSIILKGRTGETEITESDLDEWLDYHLKERKGRIEVKEVISIFYDQE